MKRKRPDPLRLARWLAIVPRFDVAARERAGELYRAWSRYARRRGACAGTPRSFSNALRKVGCPWQRQEGRRSRIHIGLQLPKPPAAPEHALIFSSDERGWPEPVGRFPATWTTPEGNCLAEPVPLHRVTRGLTRSWEPLILKKRDGRWCALPGRWLKVDDRWVIEEAE